MLQSPYDEIPIPRAPLVLVLTQAQLPPTPALDDAQVVKRIQNHLQDEYPVARTDHAVIVNQQGNATPSATPAPPVHRLEQVDKSWYVTMNSGFVALSTTEYDSRTDFVERAERLFAAVSEEAGAVACDRLGIRYIDRVAASDIVQNLDRYVSSQLLGIVSIPAADGVTAVHSLSDSLLDLGNGVRIKVRSGILPPAAVPANGVEAITEPSWIFDVDSYVERTVPFDASALAETVAELASNAYQMFRWGVTDDFIKFFGGELT